MSRICEFCCLGCSIVGSSDATAMSIPKTVETSASTLSANRTSSSRSLRTRKRFGGRRRRSRPRRGYLSFGKGTTVAPLPLPFPADVPGIVVVGGSESLMPGCLAGKVGRRRAARRADQAPRGRRTLALERMASPAAFLARDAVDCLPGGALEARLAEGRPLRVKLGLDPTAPDLHLGHTVVMQKLREFQDLGHTVVLIVGDYTARVGDPSGRAATRPVLSHEQIDANARTYREQASKVLAVDERLEVRFNSEWLDMPMEDMFRLVRHVTIAQLLERDDFAKRMAAPEPIPPLELLYPVLQGYDSVAVRADLELGGTDQTFNLFMGRALQTVFGQPGQVVLTMPLLTGLDGERKMSKSYGNAIGITDPPGEMYGRTLSIPDAQLPSWYSLLLGSPPPPDLGPRDAKRALARALVERFHGPAAAEEAEAAFDRVFIARELPEDIPDFVLEPNGPVVHLPAVIADAFGRSRSEARRTLLQGGVRLDGEPLPPEPLDVPAVLLDGRVLQLGKRHFRRLRVA